MYRRLLKCCPALYDHKAIWFRELQVNTDSLILVKFLINRDAYLTCKQGIRCSNSELLGTGVQQ